MAKRLGHAPIDQEREVKATAGLRLFVDGGEGGGDEILPQSPTSLRRSGALRLLMTENDGRVSSL